MPVGARASAGVPVDAVHARASASTMPVELRVELAPHISLSIAMPPDGVAISHADVAAIRAAAAPLIAELARRQLAVHAGEGEDV